MPTSLIYFVRLFVFSNEKFKVRNAEKIRNRYNQAPHLTQDTTWESFFLYILLTMNHWKVGEYEQEMPQSLSIDQPTTPWERGKER